MATQVNYWISAVRYNVAHTHIDKARVHAVSGNSLVSPTEWTRQSIVDSIEKGYVFSTMFQDSNGKWVAGKEVRIVTVNGVKYLRTDANSKAADNLENLPEF